MDPSQHLRGSGFCRLETLQSSPCPGPVGGPGAGARGAGGGGRGGGGAWERRLSWRLEAFASGAGLSWSRRLEPPCLSSGPVVVGTRAAGAHASRPPVMVGHLHLQAMGDTREQSRDGLLDSPDSGLPPSPSPSPPFYALSPGTLDTRATTEAPAVRPGDWAVGRRCRSQHGSHPSSEADVEWHRAHQDLQAGSFGMIAGRQEYRVVSRCPQLYRLTRRACYGYLPVDPVAAAAAASYLVDLPGLLNGGIWASSCRDRSGTVPRAGTLGVGHALPRLLWRWDRGSNLKKGVAHQSRCYTCPCGLMASGWVC